MADNPNVKELPKVAPDELVYDYSKAIHAVGEKFQINTDTSGNILIAFGAGTMDPKKIDIQAIAHVPPGMLEPLLNAMAFIANRMGIKLNNSIQ